MAVSIKKSRAGLLPFTQGVATNHLKAQPGALSSVSRSVLAGLAFIGPTVICLLTFAPN